MKRIALLLVLLAAAAGLVAQDHLLSVYDRQSKTWSYIDVSGKVRIPGPFLIADDFSEGLGRAMAEQGRTVFLDTTGKVVFALPVPFSQTAGFSEGRAWFVQNDGKMGFVDKTGKTVIPAQFQAEPTQSEDGNNGFESVFFSQGKAPVRSSVEVGWIKVDGTYVKAPGNPRASGPAMGADFSGIFPFSEGIATFQDGRLFGMVDAGGKIVAPATWDELKPVSEGLAPFRRGPVWGFVDKKGKETIAAQFDDAYGFVGGFAIVIKSDKRGIADKSGKVAWVDGADDLYPAFGPKDKTRLWVVEKKGQKGLVDSSGKVVLAPKYDVMYGFQEGTALVAIQSRFGIIDAQGKELVPTAYEELGYLHEGLAAFRKGAKWGYVNAQNKVVLGPQWDWAGDFSQGLAAVQTGGKGGLIDSKGKLVTEMVYDELRSVQGGMRLMSKDHLYGFLDAKGKVAIAAQFENAEAFMDNRALVVDHGKLKLIDPKGKALPTFEASYATIPVEGEPLLIAKGGKMGLIDPNGQFVLPAAYDRVIGHGSGITLVGNQSKTSSDWFYVDSQGKRLFENEKWHPYSTFNQDRAFVLVSPLPRTQEEQQKPMELALVDSKGQILAQGIRNEYGGFQENFAAVQTDDSKWTYIDASGKFPFEGKWDRAFPFSEGLGAVIVDGKIGYVDAKGKLVLPCVYERAAPFHSGVAWVVENGREEFIDAKGQKIWQGPEAPKASDAPVSGPQAPETP